MLVFRLIEPSWFKHALFIIGTHQCLNNQHVRATKKMESYIFGLIGPSCCYVRSVGALVEYGTVQDCQLLHGVGSAPRSSMVVSLEPKIISRGKPLHGNVNPRIMKNHRHSQSSKSVSSFHVSLDQVEKFFIHTVNR